MPAHPCMSTTAGNGPAPSGRSSHAGTASGLPGVAFGNERFVEAQPARTIETRSTDIARRSMNRAYTAPQRGAKLDGHLVVANRLMIGARGPDSTRAGPLDCRKGVRRWP